jgi:hypothetical protein
MEKQMKELNLATIESLKAELNIIQLEERFEMISATVEVDIPAGSNGICCCS